MKVPRLHYPQDTFFSITPSRLGFFATFLFFTIIFGFLATRLVPLFFTPKISIYKPNVFFEGADEGTKGESLLVQDPELVIEGMAVWVSSLTLNGEEVYIGVKGIFHKELELEEGVNIIVLEGKSWFGRKTEVVKRVIYIDESVNELTS